LVEVSDTLSRYLATEDKLKAAALSVGIAGQQWQAIKEGS
jgi:hypothetical protein